MLANLKLGTKMIQVRVGVKIFRFRQRNYVFQRFIFDPHYLIDSLRANFGKYSLHDSQFEIILAIDA